MMVYGSTVSISINPVTANTSSMLAFTRRMTIFPVCSSLLRGEKHPQAGRRKVQQLGKVHHQLGHAGQFIVSLRFQLRRGRRIQPSRQGAEQSGACFCFAHLHTQRPILISKRSLSFSSKEDRDRIDAVVIAPATVLRFCQGQLNA